MNPFNGMNRSQRRKFNKLGKKEKLEISEVAINNEINRIRANDISRSMVDGMDLQSSHLYKKYVMPIDDGNLSEKEKKEHIEKLLSAIRMGHFNYVKNHGKAENSGDSGEEVQS